MSDPNYFGAVGKEDTWGDWAAATMGAQSAASQSAVREGIAIGRREAFSEVRNKIGPASLKAPLDTLAEILDLLNKEAKCP